jgi:signal transduction histidine kinase
MSTDPSPWRSTTTRIVVSYGLFFVLWALLLVLLIYWQTASRLSDEAEHQLAERAEYFAAMDPRLLRERLQAMYEFDLLHINSYGLFDVRGNPVAGHIVALPKDLRFDGVSHIYRQADDAGHETSTRILAIRLNDRQVLLLARDAGLIDQIHDLILRAVIWGLSLTIVPGIAGGFLLSVRPLRRIRSLQQASDRIIAGSLGERLPVAGHGDELDMLAGIVNRMLDEIEHLMLEVKSVCDNVAHDLRTPMTHLRARLYRIQQQTPAADPRQAIIDRAVAETDDMLARFAGLLRISELRDEHRRAAFAAVDLAEVLQQVHSLYDALAEDKSIALALELVPLREIRGDRLLLIEAFSNLVANAIKFTPPGGRVTVRAVQEQAGPRVDVQDTGPGIELQQRRAVFERFYRADRSRSTPGFGLGLSIVDAIVRLHGFQVEAGECTGGACLTVRCWPAPAALPGSAAIA